MAISIDHVRSVLERIKTTGFWARLFGWGDVRRQLGEAAAELEKLAVRLEDLGDRFARQDKDLAGAEASIDHLREQVGALARDNIRLQQDDEYRRHEHAKMLAALLEIKESVHAERVAELERARLLESERIRELKETWAKHEDRVRHTVKTICLRHTIDYIDKVPFKGNPDNTLRICEEYVVFDAKSPGGEDLRHFPSYLKEQAEKAAKYARLENVKSDIFFVVPSGALANLSNFVYRHGDYNVYVISEDALEPVILCLKKIEDYEFAEQFSPEDRENICRILGRFAHLSKRRIQVDSFFARQFIALAYKCETDLPAEVLESMLEFERADKLNPPLEKRAKAISIGALERETLQISLEADGKGIVMDMDDLSERLNEAPLYKGGAIPGAGEHASMQ
jgi:hypothetical protein